MPTTYEKLSSEFDLIIFKEKEIDLLKNSVFVGESFSNGDRIYNCCSHCDDWYHQPEYKKSRVTIRFWGKTHNYKLFLYFYHDCDQSKQIISKYRFLRYPKIDDDSVITCDERDYSGDDDDDDDHDDD